YEQAMGAFHFIDGRYIRTHSFKHGTQERNQTLSIGAVDDGISSFIDASCAKITSDGGYNYIDSQFELNTHKYLEQDLFCNITLKNNARHNMEECCLIFTITVHSKERIATNYHSECVLNRDQNSPFDFEINFHHGYETSTPDKQLAYLEKVVKENSEIYKKLNNDFCDCMNTVKEWRGYTFIDIAARIPMEERQIRRIFNGESKGSIQALISICLALYL